MQLAIVTPVLTRTPRGHARWEAEAGIEEVARIARAADELGYHHVTCSEHVGIPVDVAAVRGSTYWDPLAVFGYLAAVTERIRFTTYVLVLAYHHPLELVKRYGTLDRVSGGRLILGVGVGSLKEEFDLIGAPFDDRGARGDESIRALTASFGRAEPEFHGEFYDYSGFIIDPTSVQAPVPIWIGGRTARSLRRAVELADGWSPFGLTLEEMAGMLDRARDSEAWAARATPLEVALQPGVFDPLGNPVATVDRLGAMTAMGATMVEARVRSDSVEHCIDQLAALRECNDALG
ncbi:MAG: LLM class F420-dependent oxidoreductase [Actinobacteria bacterium]|nr:LLM class F420-dependent oxidoreductase [Actinomycetota bacterium]